jgi:VIT1/CCC1 family predicted Fe2+/Mn2+ transporter
MSTRFAFWRKEVEEAFSEQEEHARPGVWSDFILGSQDGLVNVLAVLLGVAIASIQTAQDASSAFRIILAAGLAATFGESISMGAVAYTSTLARRDHYLKEKEREMREMKDLPHVEREEVRTIFREWGYEGPELEDIVDRIIAKPKAWLELMMAHELRLAPVAPEQARKSAILVGIAAVVGSLIPLGPFIFFSIDLISGIIGALIVSAIALFLIGWYKAKTTVGRPGRSGVQMVLIGILAALAGFGIAYLVGVAGT